MPVGRGAAVIHINRHTMDDTISSTAPDDPLGKCLQGASVVHDIHVRMVCIHGARHASVGTSHSSAPCMVEVCVSCSWWGVAGWRKTRSAHRRISGESDEELDNNAAYVPSEDEQDGEDDEDDEDDAVSPKKRCGRLDHVKGHRWSSMEVCMPADYCACRLHRPQKGIAGERARARTGSTSRFRGVTHHCRSAILPILLHASEAPILPWCLFTTTLCMGVAQDETLGIPHLGSVQAGIPSLLPVACGCGPEHRL